MRTVRVEAYEVMGEWRTQVNVYEMDDEGTTVLEPVLTWQGRVLSFDDAPHQVWAVLHVMQQALEARYGMEAPKGPHLVR